MTWKSDIREWLQRRGLEVRRFDKAHSEIYMVLSAAERSGCQVIVDIGANTGQFAAECRKAGYSGRIISVEPQVAAHADLMALAKSDPHWSVVPRMCIGERDGMTIIHISPNSTSSSLLDVTANSIEANSDTKFVADEEVAISRLDTLVPTYLKQNETFFLKIDTQGYEGAVLDGASDIIHQVGAIFLEMSLCNLYEGSAEFNDLYRRIEVAGYKCVGLFQGFTNAKTLEMLQVNGLFIRVK